MDKIVKLRTTHLTPRMAAVGSTNIAVGIFRDKHPSAKPHEALEDDLVQLEENRFEQRGKRGNSWQSAALIATDVVYGLTLPGSRQHQQLHAKFGKYLTRHRMEAHTTATAFQFVSQTWVCHKIVRLRWGAVALRWCAKEAMEHAGLKKNGIHEIVLVGGSIRIPKVQALIKEYFNGEEPNKGINSHEAVD
ncbi:hypothetical protein BSKO_02879 [Bryopsis sp. KO-2023]|nr:hypothetical protein BSKO_02879 [Bryopsis sp. KO-2023]